MFWSGETIIRNSEVVTDFCVENVDCNAYKVRMGDLYFVTSEEEGRVNTKRKLDKGETIAIPAGQFGFLLSHEEVRIPTNAMGFISMRTGFKFKGLINVSGFNVDPGYKGKLLFSVYNAGSLPVFITEGEPIFKIWFASLDYSATHRIYSKPGIFDIDSELIRGASKEILSLQSLSNKIRELEKSFDTKFSEQKPIIDNLTLVWRTATIGVIGTILVALLTVAWPTIRGVGEAIGRAIIHKSEHSNKPPANTSSKGATPAR